MHNKILCTFKEVSLDAVTIKALTDAGLEISLFESQKKIPAAYLIKSLDLQGKRIGDAEISQDDSNTIISAGPPNPEHLAMLISFIKQQVRDAYGVELEEIV